MQTTGHYIAPGTSNSPTFSLNKASAKCSASRREDFISEISTAKDVNQVIKALEELQEHIYEKYSNCCYCFLMSNHFCVAKVIIKNIKDPVPFSGCAMSKRCSMVQRR
ncbi:hypothetical protein BDR07DRAFT_699938 [Suillus spraguei]|nr:hypothetical protein BDR07DRAFT_699938 [Suillus spraguei]